MFSSADLSLVAWENELVTVGFRYDFTESRAASCMHFQCRNCHFRLFDEGSCKYFKNYYVISIYDFSHKRPRPHLISSFKECEKSRSGLGLKLFNL